VPTTPWPRRLSLVLSLFLAMTACGGGGTEPGPNPPPPPPPPGPTPVASVTVDPGTAALAPQATQQLTASTRDAQGTPLTGRTIAWTSSAPTVATVSGSGLVTAATPGSATITATSEGRTGTATITVAAGTVVGPQGGTVTLANGAVTITVPAGAVTTPVVINATVGGAPSGAPPTNWQVVGPVFQITPAGTTFSQPVTINVKFAAADLPDFAMTGDLGVQHRSGTQWSLLPNSTVNAANYVISATVTSLGTSASGPAASVGGRPMSHVEPEPWELALMAMDPQISLSPTEASVSVQRRHAGFHVAVLPRGQGLALPATASPVLFRWKTDGPHSSFIENLGPTQWTATSSVEYFTTHPVLGQLSGDIDRVVVDVCLTAPDCDSPAARIISQQALINVDREITYKLLPAPATVKRGEDITLRAAGVDNQGQEVSLPDLVSQGSVKSYEIEWTSSENFGKLGENTDPAQVTVDYTADDPFSFPPPRRETVSFTASIVEKYIDRQMVGIPGTSGKINQTAERTDKKKFVEGTGTIAVETDYELDLTASTGNPSPGQTLTVTATLDPAEPSGVAYRFTSAENQGTLLVIPGTLVTTKTMQYKVDDFPPGGNEIIRVEVVSVVQGVEWEVLATEEVTVNVDPTRAVQFQVHTFTNSGGGTGVIAGLNVTKVPGATSYQVTAQGFPEATLPLTFSGANTTGQGIPVGSILDAGTFYRITLRSGTCPPSVPVCGHIAGYQSTYGPYVYRVKVTK
jgi:hypothetical protein